MIDFFQIVEKLVVDFIFNIVEGVMNILLSGASGIMTASGIMLREGFVVKAVSYAQLLAFSLLVIKVMFEGFQTYVMREGGDPDADPTGLLIRTAQATAIIVFLPSIIVWIFDFGVKIANDVTTAVSGVESWNSNLFGSFLLQSNVGLLLALVILVMLIMYVIIFVQATIRGAELALMSFIGPFLALNLTTSNKGTWSAWLKHLLILTSSQAIQLFMMKGSMQLVLTGVQDFTIFFSLGWLWVAITTPKFLKQFVYSSGVGNAGRTVANSYVTRLMLKGGK